MVDDDEEARVLARTLTAFDSYVTTSLQRNHWRHRDFVRLPDRHRELLEGYRDKLRLVDAAIECNGRLTRAMVQHGIDAFWSGSEAPPQVPPTSNDMEKARSTVKQFMRDWSEQGRAERKACYGPILEELDRRYGHLSADARAAMHVLVPGSGLGRLPFEIAAAGYSCQGNEFSFHMLLGSNLMLNHAREHEFTVYPFVHSFSNHRSTRDDLLSSVAVPDVSAESVLAAGTATSRSFSMAAGEFIQVYGGEDARDAFDIVATVFFLDTAHNVCAYLDTIRNCLRPGGTWINLGPLLWHFEGDSNSDTADGGSIELSLDELMELIPRYGFEVQQQRTVTTTYMGSDRAMLRYVYDAELFVAQKG